MGENVDWNESNVYKILPNSFKAHVISFQPYLRGFNAVLRLNIMNKIQADDWLRDFSEKSLTNYRVDRTFPENTPKLLFKKEFRCLHNTRPTSHNTRKPHSKHTACNAKVTITIKQQGMKRSKDKYLKDFPCEIMLRHIHNHPLSCSESLKHRRPSKEVENAIMDLFSQGHSPTSALDKYKCRLQEIHGEDCEEILEDGSLFPSQKWCYTLYYNMYKKQNTGNDTNGEEEMEGKTTEDIANVKHDEGDVNMQYEPLVKTGL